MSKVVSYAPEAWNHLHGVFCVYKPVDMSVRFMRKVLMGNLSRDLNELQPRHVPPIVAIEGECRTRKDPSVIYKVKYKEIVNLMIN